MFNNENSNGLHISEYIKNTFFVVLFTKNLIAHISTFYEPEVRLWFLCLRLRQQSIERAMDLTDSFTWEDLPTRDADTGHSTAAGWIPLTMKYSRNAAIAILCFHTVQSTIRIVTNHETILIAWYPFDWTVSPFYELVNISQVTIFKTEFSYMCFYSILNLADFVKWHTSFSFLSFFRSVLFPSLFFYYDLQLPSFGRLVDNEQLEKNFN